MFNFMDLCGYIKQDYYLTRIIIFSFVNNSQNLCVKFKNILVMWVDEDEWNI